MIQVSLDNAFPPNTPITVELFNIVDHLGVTYPNLSFAVPVQ
jgi:hypothetical protein